MINISIIIGATNYQRLIKLPGSKNDAKNIFDIITLTKKYDDTLYLNNDESSEDVKESISDFIEKHKNNEINELFFYFSGHGEFSNNEFCYLLSDYDSFKKSRTSLANSFVDNLIRNLQPKMTIKIIDACQSGTNYIKSNETLNSYLLESKNQLSNCYFLFSSHTDQSSYQTKYISDFTNSFINSLKKN